MSDSSLNIREVVFGAEFPEVFLYVASLRSEILELRREILSMQNEPVDIYREVASIGKTKSLISSRGIHRRALAAMDIVLWRGSASLEGPNAANKGIDAKDSCGDICCDGVIRALRREFFLISSPLRDRKGHGCSRKVAVVGSLSSTDRFCSNDKLLFSATSKNGENRRNFFIEGRCDGDDGRPAGLLVDGHPELVRRITAFKRVLNDALDMEGQGVGSLSMAQR